MPGIETIFTSDISSFFLQSWPSHLSMSFWVVSLRSGYTGRCEVRAVGGSEGCCRVDGIAGSWVAVGVFQLADVDRALWESLRSLDIPREIEEGDGARPNRGADD